MTKKQLTEKWAKERSEAAGEASKLNVKLIGLNEKAKRLKNDKVLSPATKAQLRETKRNLELLATRIVTIDQFLKDI